METSEAELADALSRQQELERLREEMAEQRQAADLQLQSIAEEARAVEEQRGEWLQKIAEYAGRRTADEAAITDTRSSVAKSLRRVRLLQTQAGSAAAELRNATERLSQYEWELNQVRLRNAEAEAERDKIEKEADQVRQHRDQVQQQHLAGVRRIADLEASRQRAEQRVAEAARILAGLSKRIAAAKQERDAATSESAAAKVKVTELDAGITEILKAIELADAKLQESRRTLDRRREEVSALKVRLHGVTERMNMLAELQRRQEGLSGGVRTILEQLRDASSPLADKIHGIVAECFEVDVKVAPLIDSALGERSQYVIVSGGDLQEAILDGALKIDSRVGLLRLDELPKRRPGDRIRLDGLKGVIGRADRMIKCDQVFEPLCRHLLSNTWLVDSLKTALGLRKLSGAGLRFVTSSGELLENDGSTVIGPAAASTGLISRRSELASAAQEIEHYQFQLDEAAAETKRLGARVDEEAAALGRLEQKHRSLIADRAAADAELRHTDQRLRSQQLIYDEIDAEILSSNRGSRRGVA